jgi:nitroimidazol reductase NimA-like FMN-containing flavoprotein (pyridoxamine 5'-phosphate oxidase superfamily)
MRVKFAMRDPPRTPLGGRKVRRKDLEITDRAEIDRILDKAIVCRLGLSSDSQPYIVPMSFGYDGKALYFHSADEGRKIEMIRANPRVCFEVDMDHEVVKREGSCTWTIKYNSVIGFGTASIVDDRQSKAAALNALMRHYGGGEYTIGDKMLDTVAVIKVDIDSVSGKTRYDAKRES